MPCYCSTIAILENDIQVISNSITKLKEIQSVSKQISKDVLDIADKVNSNVDITNRYILFNKLKEINKGEEGKLLKVIIDYESYKLNLVSRKISLKVSDKEYHEKERLANSNNASK